MAETGRQKFLSGERYPLAGMVEYGTEAVVSRALIQKNAGNVTLFAFDRDQAIGEHAAPFDAMVYVLEGTLSVTISGAMHILDSGDSIIMPAGKPHSLKATGRAKMLLVMIRE